MLPMSNFPPVALKNGGEDSHQPFDFMSDLQIETPLPVSNPGGMGNHLRQPSTTEGDTRKRYAVVGTGGRVVMFIDPIVSRFQTTAQIVGLCDINPVRLAYHQKRLAKDYQIADIPLFPAKAFDEMLAKQQPDCVIVCTIDALHDEYIVRALNAGCEVITEKPLTTDATKCARIMEAAERSGKSVRVTFNMRWMPGAATVKKLITSGVIGQVKSAVMEYTLDTKHGADYFRRWHSEKEKSGGLLVHKSTHHFDLINWWMDSIPDKVFAFGDLAFYGRKNAVQRGEESLVGYDRYTGIAPDSDPFKLDMAADAILNGLYLSAEKEDGYIRDRNVFRADIDIEDTLSVVAKYRSGATLTYSLTAFCPSEGFRVSINGDKGRIEYFTHFKSHIIRGAANEGSAIESGKKNTTQRISVHPLFEPAYEVEIPIAEGSHGGGDLLLQNQMFGATRSRDDLNQDAGHEQGAASALLGFAANESIATGGPVSVSDLLALRPEAVRLSELI